MKASPMSDRVKKARTTRRDNAVATSECITISATFISRKEKDSGSDIATNTDVTTTGRVGVCEWCDFETESGLRCQSDSNAIGRQTLLVFI